MDILAALLALMEPWHLNQTNPYISSNSLMQSSALAPAEIVDLEPSVNASHIENTYLCQLRIDRVSCQKAMGIKILWLRELDLTLDIECSIALGVAGRQYHDPGLGGDNVVITVRSDQGPFSFGLTKLAYSPLPRTLHKPAASGRRSRCKCQWFR